MEVPEGMSEGVRLRVANRGEPGLKGAPAGSLYVQVEIEPHQFFRREGNDMCVRLRLALPRLLLACCLAASTSRLRAGILAADVASGGGGGGCQRQELTGAAWGRHVTVPVSVSQAILGAKVSVPTLGGEQQVALAAGTQVSCPVPRVPRLACSSPLPTLPPPVWRPACVHTCAGPPQPALPEPPPPCWRCWLCDGGRWAAAGHNQDPAQPRGARPAGGRLRQPHHHLPGLRALEPVRGAEAPYLPGLPPPFPL